MTSSEFWWEVAATVTGGLVLAAITGLLWLLYRHVLRRPIYLAWHFRRHDCGHWSGSYTTDTRTNKTECNVCHNARANSR